MNRILFHRLCAALLVISLAFTLPVQAGPPFSSADEIAMTLAINTEIPPINACDGCPSLPIMNIVCPAIFCTGLTGKNYSAPQLQLQLSDIDLLTLLSKNNGLLALSPDPHPPRIFL